VPGGVIERAEVLGGVTAVETSLVQMEAQGGTRSFVVSGLIRRSTSAKAPRGAPGNDPSTTAVFASA
jgi:hypothetical protein